MATTGQVLDNPCTGQRVIFHQLAADTGGQRLEFEWFVAPWQGRFPQEHVHVRLHEQYDILSGQAKYRRAGVNGRAGPGDVIDFPAQVAHVHPYSISNEELHMRSRGWLPQPDPRELDASVRLLEIAVWLAQQDKVDRDCNPSLLQAAVIAQDALAFVYVTRPPRIVQRIALAVLAPLARLLGYRVPDAPAPLSGPQSAA
jgi:hypothetical protein